MLILALISPFKLQVPKAKLWAWTLVNENRIKPFFLKWIVIKKESNIQFFEGVYCRLTDLKDGCIFFTQKIEN